MPPSTAQDESSGADSVAPARAILDGDARTHRREFDGQARPAIEVVNAVAEVAQTDPLDLPPLFDVVDTGALNALFDRSTGSPPQSEFRLVFEYADHHVVVEPERIQVTPIPRDE